MKTQRRSFTGKYQKTYYIGDILSYDQDDSMKPYEVIEIIDDFKIKLQNIESPYETHLCDSPDSLYKNYINQS